MAKIFIATPAFTGQCHVLYAISLAQTFAALSQYGHEAIIRMHSSGSLLVAERNALLDAFLKTDCTHILCIDSDLGWRHEAVLTMLEHDKDFMAGCYPVRNSPGKFHFVGAENEDGSLVQEGDLIKMLYVPAGFMLIKRHVIEQMQEAFPEYRYEPIDPDAGDEKPGVALFNTEVYKGVFWGEDYVFCRRARQAGFEIWCDPRFGFNHSGTLGALAENLTQEKDKMQKSVRDFSALQD